MNPKSPVRHMRTIMLNESELADRWQTSKRTLQRWRARHIGPPFIRIEGIVRYRLAEIEEYEERMRRGGEAEP